METYVFVKSSDSSEGWLSCDTIQSKIERSLGDFLENEIREAAEDGKEDFTISVQVRLVEMTEEEYDALPEL